MASLYIIPDACCARSPSYEQRLGYLPYLLRLVAAVIIHEFAHREGS